MQSMIRNAKRKKVSKNPYVKYPDIAHMKKAFGIRVNPNYKKKSNNE